jgi:hypothetical protein
VWCFRIPTSEMQSGLTRTSEIRGWVQ